jgi:hypothetical protein
MARIRTDVWRMRLYLQSMMDCDPWDTDEHLDGADDRGLARLCLDLCHGSARGMRCGALSLSEIN